VALPLLLDAVERLPAFTRLLNTLPAPGERRTIVGLPGSSAAVLAAALARRLPGRFFAIVTQGLPEAERWLADLQSLASDTAVALYPPREGFGEAEPHAEIAGERVETLERVGQGGIRIVLTTARAILERTLVPSAVERARLELRPGDTWRPQDLASHLDSVGFERAPMVEEVAQYSVRGGILDIYGFGMADPVRLEFVGDEIAELRHFDLLTQRSTRPASVALILPVDRAGVTGGAGGRRDGVDLLDRASFNNLWPPDTIVVTPEGAHLEPEFRRTWDEAQHHIEVARRRGEDAPVREELYQPPDVAAGALARLANIVVESAGHAAAEIAFPIRPPDAVDRDIARLGRIVRDGVPTLILCDNAGQCERLDELLAGRGPAGPGSFQDGSPATLAVGVLDGGFVVPPVGTESGLRVLTDHEIFRRERRIRRARRYAGGTSLESVTALQPGDYVVHLEHGVGIYRGIETIFVKESTVEVAVVEYEGGDRLNVPLYRIDQLERYRAATDVGADSPPPRLHKLGGKRWSQQRDKTRSAIREMTAELLELYARRQVAHRPPHAPDGAWQRQLESSFLFEDTPDQRKATADVKSDMERVRPMDRLLVGDVGYGKTEIAVRAAFKAVQSGRQVAVLVPTTILADQHLRTFGDRYADFPLRVEALSRFQSASEQKAILADLAAKKVDVVIGTHRLLSPDVQFAELGIIVIDEEHRFGVRHKERLKQLRLETDVLTLTATPIPRTLHFSLAGLRDMTLMQTPPRDRSPVLTFVEPWDDGLIEEGINRELDRGGQVFFVHNRIETIEAIKDHVKRLVPRARVAVGHGQMREHELEEVMRRFVNGEVDVLVSTMIVESGLDVANANTMFVNRADSFGLAQLYQLRGRVGRSHRRAYCYLMVPDAIDPEAERRLQVLEHHTELGSGYRVALRDMEMRGAGNILGPEQSGFVQAVGFDLYLRMLDEQVRVLRHAAGAPKTVPAEVSFDVPVYLPDEYVPLPEAKLDIYRRLTRLTDANEVDALKAEVRDRFGVLPPPAEAFFAQAILRLVGGALRVEGILVRGTEARVTFRADAVPKMKGLSAAFHDVQFQIEVRRTQPLSLKLTRLGGAELLGGLVRALRQVAAL
jgi:transcription-repair coupling factor (superfamily II helicase)